MTAGFWIAVLIAVAASAGQIVLKLAVERQKVDGVLHSFQGLQQQPLLWTGVLIYGACSIAWL